MVGMSRRPRLRRRSKHASLPRLDERVVLLNWRVQCETAAGAIGSAADRLGVGGKRAEDAELVAFRVGEHHPGDLALAHVGTSGSQTDQPLHLRLVRAVNRPDVQMQAVLDRLPTVTNTSAGTLGACRTCSARSGGSRSQGAISTP